MTEKKKYMSIQVHTNPIHELVYFIKLFDYATLYTYYNSKFLSWSQDYKLNQFENYRHVTMTKQKIWIIFIYKYKTASCLLNDISERCLLFR